MCRVFLTGDCHKQFSRLKKFCENNNTTRNDILILLGDSGINYCLDENDIADKKFLSKLPITIIVIQGNHEKYVGECDGYDKVELNGTIRGEFYIQKEYLNLLFCKNIDLFFINDKSFAVMGGAYSVDKPYRIANGYRWFESEQIPEKDMQSFIHLLEFNLKNSHEKMRYNYVLSHTCPTKYMPIDLFLPMIDQATVDRRTEDFLETVEELIEYDNWFFGHFHDNREAWDKGVMLYEDIIELSI